MHASLNVGYQGKSGPGKIHEVILVLFIIVIWISSCNDTNHSLSTWGKQPTHCDKLLMLIQVTGCINFCFIYSDGQFYCLGQQRYEPRIAKKNFNLPQTLLDNIACVHGFLQLQKSWGSILGNLSSKAHKFMQAVWLHDYFSMTIFF